MSTNAAYLTFITELLAPLGSIAARGMMGGHILYCNSTVFALIAHNTLYLKADDRTRPHFEERGLKPFYPFDGHSSMSYYQPPPEFFEDETVLMEWGRMAVGAGLRSQSKKSKRKSAPARKNGTAARKQPRKPR